MLTLVNQQRAYVTVAQALALKQLSTQDMTV